MIRKPDSYAKSVLKTCSSPGLALAHVCPVSWVAGCRPLLRRAGSKGAVSRGLRLSLDPS